jgi:putative ABC transport system permease protein
MLLNYIRTALRNLRRNIGYTTINIIGLGVGIASVLLIFLYVQHELSYDNYHEKKDRIFRITEYSGFGEKEWNSYVNGDPVPELRKSYTNVEDAIHMKRCGSRQIVRNDEIFENIDMVCSDSHLFKIFSFDVVSGKTESLDRPNTAVITRSLARKIFGDENPVGKTIPIHFDRENRDFEITGLMEDVPANTHFDFDLLLSYESLKTTRTCLTCGKPMYVLLKPGADTETISNQILKHIREIDGKEHVEDIALQPLEEIYFGDISAENKGDMGYLYILSAIALLILFIACANYMNMATSNYTKRANEIGIRKVLGGYRNQLIRQFLMETLVLAALSLPIALLILQLVIPYFNVLAQTNLSFMISENLSLVFTIIGILLFVALAAGSYPALYLSSFRPAKVLKGRQTSDSSSSTLRKSLVVGQFLVSLVMITLTFIVMEQLHFMQNRNLGFDSGQIILVSVPDPVLQEKPEVLKNKFSQIAGVKNVSGGFGAPGAESFSGRRYIYKPKGENGPSISFTVPTIGKNFLKTYNIPLLAGRNIEEWSPEEKGLEVLINQQGIDAMDWEDPHDAVGREISGYKVVGVVPNFNFESLHHKIGPLLLQQNQSGRVFTLALKIQTSDFNNVRANLEKAWNDLGTIHPLELSFLDEKITQAYEQEQNTAKVVGIFAVISIVLACLGLFGLASYTAERRMKEIGVRKVFGATVRNIISLLYRDFGLLIGFSFVLSVPIIYVIAQEWLQNFAYKVDVTLQVYATAFLVTVLLVLIATGYQSIKAALKNPVDVIRYE